LDKMVIFIDEIDKMGSRGYSSSWNQQVQANFLTVFEDKNSNRGTSFIFAGAFSGLTGKKHQRTGIGFFAESKPSQENAISDDHLIEYGMLPELIGRICGICQLDEFTAADYMNILEQRLLPKKVKDMLHYNLDIIDLSTAEKLALCKKAESSGQGVRALQRELDKLFIDKEFDYEEVTNGPRARI
jgi:ATP-dependent protease Clp ATPase subunit